MATYNKEAWEMYDTYAEEMKTKVNAMVRAAIVGETAKVQEFLAAGVDVNAVNSDGISALVIACDRGHGDIVRLLLDYDANVNHVNKHGDSALVWACMQGHGDIVRLLLDHDANVNHVTKDGDTPVHMACKYYNPSEQNRIDVCIILIENGADTSIRNKDGLTPIEVLGTRHSFSRRAGYNIDTDEAKPIKRALERQEYSKLEAGSKPVTVKLFLLGDAAAGKTTVRQALLMKNTPLEATHDPTPGIDVGTYDIDGVGKLSIWDAAGQIEYHITHGMFLGNENAVVVVVYDLQEGQKAQEKLDYWMKFLKCGNPAATKSKLKIIILASHLDKIPNERTARRVARGILRAIKRDFDEAFEIADTVLMVNARLCQSEGMNGLRRVLKDNFEKIQGSRTLPKLCEKILERKAEWVTTKSPILPYEEYKEKVREIHHLVTDDFIRISANYLRDMGEIFLAQKGSYQGHVVLDTQWLSYNIIGPTFAGSEFEGELRRLPHKPCYTQEELEDYYEEIADFPTLALLLQGLELMVTLKEGEYIIPAKLATSSKKPQFKLKYGRSIFCVDKTMFAPILFPGIQGRILKDPSFKGNQPLVTLENLQFTMDAKGWVWQMLGNKDVINFAVEGVTGNEEGCYKSLNKIQEMIVLALNEFSPGTKVETGYLSPFSLQNSDLKSVAYYKMEEIEQGDDRQDDLVPKNSTVLKEVPTEQEKITDILIAGFDPHFIRKKGVQCKYHWMLHQKKLYSLMDKPNSLRTDYRSLAELLQVDEYDTCDSSHTKAIITHWCKTTGKNMTLGMLYTMLKHPGLIGNDQGAGIIQQMLKDNVQHSLKQFGIPYPRTQDPFQMDKIRMLSGGLPDGLLLWRAVLRKTHTVLQEEMEHPVEITKSLRSSRTLLRADEEDIINESNQSGVKAVDLLISKLIPLKKPDWPDQFLKALKPHHPHVVEALTEVQKILKEDILASVPLNITEDMSHAKKRMCGNGKDKQEPEEKRKKQDVPMVSDSDITNVVKTLEPSDLAELYIQFGLTTPDVTYAESKAGNSSDIHQRARHVLEFWRDTKAQEATRKTVLEALEKCENREAKEELEIIWNMPADYDSPDVATSGATALPTVGESHLSAKASDQDFTCLIKQLGPDELQALYTELGLSAASIAKAERSVDRGNVEQRAMGVLRTWRKINGKKATCTAILKGLEKCRFVNAKQKLEELWKQ